MSLNYASYDFDSALAQLESTLSGVGSWKDRYKSATGQQLLRLLAYVIDMDGYKTERRAQESLRRFARLRSSLVEIAWNIGYKARRKVSSVCTLRFSATSVPVVIPIGTVCSSSGGVKFVTTEQGTISTSYVDLAAKQGDPKELEFTSDGLVSQKFTIPSSGDDVEAVENSSVEVDVDGDEYTEVESFVGQASTAKVFTLTRKSTYLQVQFGDGDNGVVPANEAVITISWLESLGTSGNVPTVGGINSITSDGFTGVTVANTDSAQGGEDEEDIEEIRANMSEVWATGDRVVTAVDYRSQLLAYPGVSKASVYGEQDVLSGATNPDYAWRVELVLVPTGGGTLTRTQEEQIEAFLATKKDMTVWITFKDPTYVYIDFVADVKVDTDYDLDTVKAAVEAALDALLSFQGTDLGDALRYSDVVAAIDGVEGVSSSIVDVFATKNAGTGAIGKTVFASTDSGIGNIELAPVDLGNMIVYIETIATGARRRVGYDDGAGAFASSALITSPRVSTGTINYETGAFSITFDDPVTSAYKVVIRYQTGSSDEVEIEAGDGYETTFTGALKRNVSPSFITVLREGIEVGEDDGAGAIIDNGSGEISGGTINYATGDIQILFTTAPGSEEMVSVNYYYENQDIETALDEMLLMGVKEITVEESED